MVLLIITSVVFVGCEKKSIDLGTGDQVYNPNAPSDSVRFSTNIIPIFNANCISCHATGTTAPDLTDTHAYNSLTAGPVQYINLSNPSSSRLYTWITETPNSHTGGVFAPQGEQILIWIQQGAKNN